MMLFIFKIRFVQLAIHKNVNVQYSYHSNCAVLYQKDNQNDKCNLSSHYRHLLPSQLIHSVVFGHWHTAIPNHRTDEISSIL